MVERLKNKKGIINLKDEMIRFVACTSARCFINIELDNEFYDNLIKFTNLTNNNSSVNLLSTSIFFVFHI